MATDDGPLPAQAVVGRQAIADRSGATVGYELLFRASGAADAAGDEYEAASMTADVALNAMTIGLDVVTDGSLAFCNIDQSVLTGELPMLFPDPRRVVLEVPSGLGADVEAVDGCRRLVEQGWTLALDGVDGGEDDRSLLELVDVVKVDVGRHTAGELADLAALARDHDTRVLAQRVETAEQHATAYDLGFDLFQGYLVDRPVVVTGRALEPEGLSRLAMASLMLKSDLDVGEVVDLLRTDPSLAVGVLRLASIGRAGETRRRVASLRDAVVLAGTRQIQNWMSVILLRPWRSEGRSRYLDVLVRARSVENLAAGLGLGSRDVAFAAGMLSALDLHLSMSVDQLRQFLDVDETLALAAFGEPVTGARTTPLSHVVRAARDYQLGLAPSPDAPVPVPDLEAAFADAFSWAGTTLQQLDTAQRRSA
ncbi:EAL and HDOD domain-containing protein [Lapillicoccus jejuensis]|uniref:EAL and modified HD-GYP domain-containing signal transduction protein n=1 Tax=Lapillicoccus jejuensis TaxID=402171 RepID=A0A542E4V2_9MICO|nr:EAL domain-containing protein [Lapillicoccus jejuensis]TQJ10373.1 EAL and modified HD-GYP domain-containing signal transduction protein [Lapillicoccus jejuensis]